jgi:hypothetical protein
LSIPNITLGSQKCLGCSIGNYRYCPLYKFVTSTKGKAKTNNKKVTPFRRGYDFFPYEYFPGNKCRNEALVSNDNGTLKADIENWRAEFTDRVERCPRTIIDYTTTLTTALNDAGIRVSPRRARLLSRTLLATSIINGEFSETVARVVLKCALPQPAGRPVLLPKRAIVAVRKSTSATLFPVQLPDNRACVYAGIGKNGLQSMAEWPARQVRGGP